MLKNWMLLLAILCCLGSAGIMSPSWANSPAVLTESEVRGFIKEGEAAAKMKDVDKLVSFLAPEAVIQITINGKTQQMNREQYYETSKKGMQKVSHYQYQNNIEGIKIEGNRATVQTLTYERFTVTEAGQSKTVSAASRNLSYLEKRHGKLLLIQGIANARLSQSQ